MKNTWRAFHPVGRTKTHKTQQHNDNDKKLTTRRRSVGPGAMRAYGGCVLVWLGCGLLCLFLGARTRIPRVLRMPIMRRCLVCDRVSPMKFMRIGFPLMLKPCIDVHRVLTPVQCHRMSMFKHKHFCSVCMHILA